MPCCRSTKSNRDSASSLEEGKPLDDVNSVDYPFGKGGSMATTSINGILRMPPVRPRPNSPRGCLTVQLTQGSAATLGIGVAGGIDRNFPPTISCLRPGSAAHRCDQIQAGDWLTGVNGVSTLTLTHEQVLTLLRNVGGDVVKLDLQYDLNDRCFERPFNTRNKCTDITLEKEGAGFGFTLRGGSYGPDEKKSRPITVTAIRPGGPADREGRLRVGDRILSLNGIDIFSATLQSVLKMLTEASNAISITIEYDVSILETLKKAKGPLQLEIEKPPGVDLGVELAIRLLSFDDKDGRLSALIQSIIPASVADRCGALQVDDEVLSIDGIYLEQTTQAEVRRLLRGSNSKLIRLEIVPRRVLKMMLHSYGKNGAVGPLVGQRNQNGRTPSNGRPVKKKSEKTIESSAPHGKKPAVRAKSHERPYAYARLEESVAFRSHDDADKQPPTAWFRGGQLRVDLMSASYHGSAPNISNDRTNGVRLRTSGILSDFESAVSFSRQRSRPTVATHVSNNAGWWRPIGSLSASLSGVPCGQVCHSEVMEVVLNSYTRGGFGLILHKQQPCYNAGSGATPTSSKAPLFISYIERASPADKSGVLQVGDRILAIGDYCTANGTAEEANYIIRHATSPLVLTVEFDVIETVLPSSGVFTVKLAKRGQNLGVVITSTGQGQKGEPVVISDIKTGSVAHRCGSIQPGDQLQSIDNIPLDSCTVEEAVRLLHRSSDIVKLRIKKAGVVNNDDSDSPQTVVYTVELSRRGGPLGITIGYADDRMGPVFISQLAPGGLADRTGALHVGDRILGINGHALQGRPVSEAMELMKSPTDTIALKIARCVDPAPPSTTQPHPAAQYTSYQPGFFNRRSYFNQLRFGTDNRPYQYDQSSENDASEKLGTPVQSIDSAVESLDDSPSAGGNSGGDTAQTLTTAVNYRPTSGLNRPKYTEEQLAKCAEELSVQLHRTLTSGNCTSAKDAVHSPVKCAGGVTTMTNGEVVSTSSSGHPSSEHGGGWDSGLSSADTHNGERFCRCSCQHEATSKETDESWMRILEALETVGESEMLKKLEESIMAGSVPQCDHGTNCRPQGSTYPTGATLTHPPIPFPITNTILRHPHMTSTAANVVGGGSSINSRFSTTAPETSTNGSSLSINSSVVSNHSGSQCPTHQSSPAKIPPPPPPKPPLNAGYQGLISPPASILSSPSTIVPGVQFPMLSMGPSTSTLKSYQDEGCTSTTTDTVISSIPFITTPPIPPEAPSAAVSAQHPLEVIKVTLFKDKEYNDFGFSVSDGEQVKGVYVNKIRGGGPADMTAAVRPFDRILQVNSTSLEKQDCVAFALPLLQASGDKVSLLLCRDPNAAPFLPPTTIEEEDETTSIKDSAV